MKRQKQENNLSSIQINMINKRVLVRNSQKYVYKKLCEATKQQWCKSYLSVVTSKLQDPFSKKKLPHSLIKLQKTKNKHYTNFRSHFNHFIDQNRSTYYDNSGSNTWALKQNHNRQNIPTINKVQKQWKKVKVISFNQQNDPNITSTYNLKQKGQKLKTIQDGQLIKIGENSIKKFLNINKHTSMRYSIKLNNIHRQSKNVRKNMFDYNNEAKKQNSLTPWRNQDDDNETLREVNFFQ